MAGLLDFLQTSAEDKQGALNMGLLQAGLGILANNTNRNNPMQAIGKGGMMGLQGYQGALENSQKEKLQKLQQMQLVQKFSEQEVVRKRKEAILNDPSANPQLKKYIGMGGDIGDLAKIQNVPEGGKAVSPLMGMLGGDSLIAKGNAKVQKPMVEHNFSVGNGMVQPHISFDEGRSWYPLTGSAPSPKHAAPANTTIKLPTQENAFEKGLGEGQAKELLKSRDAADDAKQMIETNKVGREIMNKGMVTGFGANAIISIGQALKTAGIDFGGDATANSQAYTANIAQNVGKLIKQFGAGTGLSDADREYATKMAGGLITLDANAIKKILDINDKAAKTIIKLHNKRAFGVKTNIPLTVDESSDGWEVVK